MAPDTALDIRDIFRSLAGLLLAILHVGIYHWHQKHHLLYSCSHLSLTTAALVGTLRCTQDSKLNERETKPDCTYQ